MSLTLLLSLLYNHTSQSWSIVHNRLQDLFTLFIQTNRIHLSTSSSSSITTTSTSTSTENEGGTLPVGLTPSSTLSASPTLQGYLSGEASQILTGGLSAENLVHLSSVSTRLLTRSIYTENDESTAMKSHPNISNQPIDGDDNDNDNNKVVVELDLELLKKVIIKLIQYTSINADLLTEDENKRLFDLLRQVG